jgi:hypothetical protein
MDWRTFFSKLAESLAWPFVVLSIVLVLRKDIADLLPRLRKLKHKDTELEFAERVAELAKEVEPRTEGEKVQFSESSLSDQFDFILKLAAIAPRSAVLEAFRVLEAAALKAVALTYPNLDANEQRNQSQLFSLLKGSVLDLNQFHQFNELRRLRNNAAHADRFELRGIPIESYINIALSLANQINSYHP